MTLNRTRLAITAGIVLLVSGILAWKFTDPSETYEYHDPRFANQTTGFMSAANMADKFQEMNTVSTIDPTEEPIGITGVIRFEGPRPKRAPLRLREKGGKVSACQELHKTPLLDEKMMVSEKGELANVFVYVRKGLEKKEYPIPEEPAVINQDKCMFRPRVQGVRIGQKFLMRNSDPVLHNVRSFSFKNRAFNVAQPADTEDREKVFRYREKEVMVQCDIHPWMTAYYFVMDHPYFAVTNAKGEYKIEGLPPGEYTLSAWHEELGEQQLEVTVAEAGSTELGFTFKEKTE